ncbi:hypothetical protein LPJ61_000847 [Coemansia biformis]|uniref:Cytochrome b5 heme-binding domain-containing protein n=1 Tax=Coemansia biformis TaxID=1286918 RepID=A0A9W7YFZ3_9FUNG|nr:hypothetical protein LPJ61_000847 [Coemansia biformis]
MAAVEEAASVPPHGEPPAPGAAALPEARQSRLPPCTPAELRQRISGGEYLVIINGLVCKLNGFVDKHPGGPLAIMHMVGRDATDEVVAMHPGDVYECTMPRWAVARFVPDDSDSSAISYVEDMDLPYSAPRLSALRSDGHAQPGKASDGLDYAAIQRDYRLLDQRLHREGYYKCNYKAYALELALFVALVAGAMGPIVSGSPRTWPCVFAAICMALLRQQTAFLAHDLGHCSVTGRRRLDWALGIFFSDFLGGISLGWWKKDHNVHHIVTNDPDNDPDIQHLPFIANSTRFFESPYSTYYGRVMQFGAVSRLLVSLQDKLYYPIMAAISWVTLYVMSWSYLLFSDFAPFRLVEIGCVLAYAARVGLALSCIPTWRNLVLFVVVSNSAAALLGVQILLSHYAMSTESPDPVHECFCARQVRTTMDISCPAWLDWFHGGLQFQIEHHLFPRLPRHKLKRVQPMVKDLCRRHGIEFKEFSFIDGNVYTVRWLGEVASRVKLYNAHEHSKAA